jgi:Leucine-rich repeat (LRR) protein
MKRFVSMPLVVTVVLMMAGSSTVAQAQQKGKTTKPAKTKSKPTVGKEPAVATVDSAAIKQRMAEWNALDEVHKTTKMYESLEEALKEPEQVIRLNLSKRDLTSIPPEIGQLKNLKVLSLYGNQLTNLPPEFANLAQLQSLDLGKNRFPEVPPQLLKLNNLKVLYLTSNRITVVPPALFKLKNLLLLELAGNQLETLPPDVGNLTNLMELNLRVNRIETLPKTMGKLKMLNVLRLNDNPIPDKEVQKLKAMLQDTDIRVTY